MRRIRENEKNKRMMKKNRDWKKVQQKQQRENKRVQERYKGIK